MFLKQINPRSDASRATMLVLRTPNFQWATIRPIVPRTKNSVVFIVPLQFQNHMELFSTFFDEIHR